MVVAEEGQNCYFETHFVVQTKGGVEEEASESLVEWFEALVVVGVEPRLAEEAVDLGKFVGY